ncbi:hypothetical protein D3C84_1030810 [compost metagenome]
MPKMRRSSSSLNCSIVIGACKNSVMFATRERTDLVDLDSTFIGFTLSAEATCSISEANSNVPWLNILPRVANMALPDTLRSPI